MKMEDKVTAQQQPLAHRFSPYADNGGSVLAVSGSDFVIVAGDTRMSTGYSIYSRNHSKISKLTDKCIIATGGMAAEATTLHKVLQMRIKMYEHEHRRQPSVTAIAQLLSTILYNKRFFPYYTFNLLAGIDDEGKGAVYGYDAIGSHERLAYGSQGSGNELITSVLDNQLKKTNQKLPGPQLSKVEVIDLVKDVITSAGERDIYTGDGAEIFVLDAAGITKSMLELKKD